MTGSSGGQQPAETPPPEVGLDVPVDATPPAGGDRTAPPADATSPAMNDRTAAPADQPTAPGSGRGASTPGDRATAGSTPAPSPRAPAGTASGYEATAATPFGGASPALGSPWSGAPGTLPHPSVIEPTTGAPLAMLPQRAPRATGVPRAPAARDETVPSAIPAARTGSARPETGAEEEDDNDFWLPIEEVHWDGRPVEKTPRTWYGRPRKPPAEAGGPRPARPPKPPPNPVLGLAGVILFSLAASFFAWVSAEPWWLAIGHGEQGTVIVESCRGRGLGQHCRGEFVAADGRLVARDVRLIGMAADPEDVGLEFPARIIDGGSTKAYVGSGTGLLHLHWSLGLGVVLICTAAVGWCTGALRLADRGHRHRAALVSYAGPLLLTAGFLVAAY
ncbi:hypothetical protein [Plantactinospora sp. B5E13]|uniref:hypothetical protein n=1 Tax=unclassified Plantactinospora TaxID=2631981 RepID=UPI00325E807A